MNEQLVIEQALSDVRLLMTKLKADGAGQVYVAAMPVTTHFVALDRGAYLATIPSEMAFELFAHLETRLQRRLDVLRGARAS